MKHGKHYVDAAKLVDSTKAYDVNEALELACKTASAWLVGTFLSAVRP